MASFQANPVEVIQAPNFYSYLPDRQWVITGGSQITLWGQLFIIDSLGTRRYVLPSTASLKVTFQRADSTASQSQPQTVVKTATPHVQDRSLFSFNLATSDTNLVIGGSVVFDIIDTAGAPSSWIQNYGLKKLLVAPGF